MHPGKTCVSIREEIKTKLRNKNKTNMLEICRKYVGKRKNQVKEKDITGQLRLKSTMTSWGEKTPLQGLRDLKSKEMLFKNRHRRTY